MQKDIRVASPQATAKRTGLVKQSDEYGFKQVFEYQKTLLSSILWTTKDHILRIIPGNDGSEVFKQINPGYIYTEDGDKTEALPDTFYMTQTLSRFGESALNIVANLKPDSEDAIRYPGESPLSYFANTITRVMRAVNQGKPTKVRFNDKWRAWTNMGGILTYPKQTLFFQAVCLQINGRPCKQSMEEEAPDAPLYGIIGINHKPSIGLLLNALVKPMNRNKPWSAENSEYGALAEAQGNILFLNTSVDNDGKKYLNPSVQEASATGWTPQPYPIEEDVCKTMWIPWKNVFNYLTVKEQLELLAQEFGADTVNYVFSLSSIWKDLDIPERIRAAGLGSYNSGKGIGGSPVSMAIPKPNISNKPSMPSFNTPSMSMKSEEPAGLDMNVISAEIAKIKAATGKSKAGNLAADLLQDLDDTDLNG